MENFTNLKKILSIVFALMAPYVFGQSPVQTIKSTNSDGYRLIVKFSPDYVFDAEEGNLFLSPHKNIPDEDLIILKDYEFEQVLEFTNEEKSQMRAGIYLLPRGKNSFNIYKFRGLMYLKGAETKTFEELNAIAKKLELIDFVEYTDLMPLKSPPDPTSTNNGRSDTPDLTHHQDYRQYFVGGDVFGINIDFAWAIGIYGQGIEIADIESGFDYEHEDLERAKFTALVPHWDGVSFDHGTAVCGVMFAIENDYGMTGMVHEADKFYGISRYPNSDAQELVPGITTGIEELNEGDVFLFELQSFGPFPPDEERYIPIDWDETVWDLTQQATDAGIIVVAAGGNGSVNLDDEPLLDEYLARGDNGAIIVGAGTRNGRNRADFSTYGSRIILQGWGDWTVATTGYGALYHGGEHATYTGSFAGTSSATPIVASAAVAVQSYAKNYLGTILTPLQMRALLFETGTPQGTGWGDNTVRLPNVAAAIQQLMEDHDIPANDFCNTATELSCDELLTGSTVNSHNFSIATLGNCGGVDLTHKGVWFSYTPQTSQYATVTTDHPSTNFDTRLRVFTSTGAVPCEGPFVCVAGNDDIDSPAPGPESRVSFVADANETYFIYLDGLANAVGEYGISLECRPLYALDLQVFLQGPYDEVSGEMNTDLNDNNELPNGQPFNADPWNYTGTETLPNPLPSDVVDWVLVEIRYSAGTLKHRRAGLLHKDGTVSIDYQSASSVDVYDWDVVVYHRNHMPVMSANSFGLTAEPNSYDFTDINNVHLEGAIELEPGVYGMIGGDVNNNGVLKYSGPGNDRGLVLGATLATGGNLLTPGAPGYHITDVNLNTTVSYGNAGNDRSFIIENINELTGLPLLTAVYESVVPGYSNRSLEDFSKDGPVNISLKANEEGFYVSLATTQGITDGLVDNIQFTLAWFADDTEMEQLISDFQTNFMLQPQGEVVKLNEVAYQVFATAVPVYLPANWYDEELRALWLSTDNATVSRLWLADDHFTVMNNADFYISIWGQDHTGYIMPTVVSAKELDEQISLRIYPNPVIHNELFIDFEGVSGEELQLSILDMRGKILMTFSSFNNGQATRKIDLSQLEAGMYLINVKGEKLNYQYKFVILNQ